MFLSINTYADTLKVTYIDKTIEPSKSDVTKAINNLTASLSVTSDSLFKENLEAARSLIAKKEIKQKFNAAIVVASSDEDKKEMNITQYENFLEEADSLCYNGKLKTAFEVANLIKDDLWIYDEYTLDSIVIEGDSIVFKVMDLFSFSDQDATEDQKDEFITNYIAPKCK